ncbi:MAG: TatD family hydrolase [Oscillospiraceae bacterium]|nr:TatD family hydrolase [Oscillospiraceae bacterium]
MYIDTHAHYDDKAFDTDRNELLSLLPAYGVEAIIDPGCNLSSSMQARSLAEAFPHVYFAAGIHPEELTDLPDDWLSQITRIADSTKCVAIGEIGLDYYWDASEKELQKQVFEAQLNIAHSLNLPVIIHDREAHGDCFEIISRHRENRGVFHCYSGSAEMASELLKMGWYLGFDGPITYKNARKAVEVLSLTPLDKILIETDSPYLSPIPVRGKRNDSRNLRFIVEKIAEVKGLSVEEIVSATSQNAKMLFQLA